MDVHQHELQLQSNKWCCTCALVRRGRWSSRSRRELLGGGTSSGSGASSADAVLVAAACTPAEQSLS
jgi:hypothetical protein